MLRDCSDLDEKSIGNKGWFGENILKTASMVSWRHYI